MGCKQRFALIFYSDYLSEEFIENIAMRSPAEIKAEILNFASNNENVRAVLLNGSRANPQIVPDNLQDFDVVFVVLQIAPFLADHTWIEVFGQTIITQLPDAMAFGEKSTISFAYLMQFKDGNRIDLTLLPVDHVANRPSQDSLTVVWLDKDDVFNKIPPPSDRDYHVRRPSEELFRDTCNEFWWVSTYVAKGLARLEVTYAKEMLETAVRPMFMAILGWKVGCDHNFKVSVGKAGKFLHSYLSEQEYQRILMTYADHDLANNWESLFLMAELFSQYAQDLAGKLKFAYNTEEQENTLAYLRKLARL